MKHICQLENRTVSNEAKRVAAAEFCRRAVSSVPGTQAGVREKSGGTGGASGVDTARKCVCVFS